MKLASVQRDYVDCAFPTESIFIWFATIFFSMRIYQRENESSPCEEEHSIHSFPSCVTNLRNKMYFFHYYRVLGNDQLAIDYLDRSLPYIRLKWNRFSGDPGKSLSSKQCGLIPIYSIRGIVHFIPVYTELGSKI